MVDSRSVRRRVCDRVAKDDESTSAAAATVYGWDELAAGTGSSLLLDASLSVEAFSTLQEQLNALDLNGPADRA